MTENRAHDGNRFQILSLDGGGLKGLFAASFLASWEESEGRPVTEYFDLIAGTSTGGIIALALGCGYRARQILEFYVDEASNIFPPSCLAQIRSWINTKYAPDGLERALARYFGTTRLGNSKIPLIIPAYFPKAGDVYIFKTPHHKRLRNDYKELMADVARATSAAPTYFAPYESEGGVRLVDGGVWANNPVMIAAAEAMGYFEIPQHNVAALRIGTTTEVVSLNALVEEGGKLQMASAVLNFMMRGQERSASNMVQHLLTKDRYHEVNVATAPGDFALDKFSDALIGFGRNEWRKQSSELADKGFLNHKPKQYVPCYN